MSISRNTTAKKLLSEFFLDDNLVYVFLHFLFKSFWQTLVLFSEATDAYNFYLSSRTLSISVNGSTFRRSKPTNGKYCPLVRHFTRNVQAIVYSSNSDTADCLCPDNVYCCLDTTECRFPDRRHCLLLYCVMFTYAHQCFINTPPPSPGLPTSLGRSDVQTGQTIEIDVVCAVP